MTKPSQLRAAIETRTTSAELETRTLGEIRAIDDEGEFTGYIAVWDTVDAYESTFKRGAFSKTIQERASRVKVYYNHAELVGRSLEIREDDHGVFVRGKLTTAVQKAKDVLEFMRDGTLTGMSFGFQVVKEAFADGVRQILEVRLFEYGPVDFPANDRALITGHRAERIMADEEDADEEDADESRADTFADTLQDKDLSRRGYELLHALEITLGDVWWETDDIATIVGKHDAAIAEFHAAYLEWSGAFIQRFLLAGETRMAPQHNELAASVAAYLTEDGRALDAIATDTSLTLAELRTLRRGGLIDAREKLTELPDAIKAAHRAQRSTAVETLCSSIRGGLTPAETRRLAALLGPVETQQSEPGAGEAITAHLRAIRNQLNLEGNSNA